jgi:hypothetical protein
MDETNIDGWTNIVNNVAFIAHYEAASITRHENSEKI